MVLCAKALTHLKSVCSYVTAKDTCLVRAFKASDLRRVSDMRNGLIRKSMQRTKQ